MSIGPLGSVNAVTHEDLLKPGQSRSRLLALLLRRSGIAGNCTALHLLSFECFHQLDTYFKRACSRSPRTGFARFEYISASDVLNLLISTVMS